MATKARKAQALIELAVGMFVIALVLTTIFAYIDVIVNFLDIQRNLRVRSGVAGLSSLSGKGLHLKNAKEKTTVEVDAYPARFVFGTDSVSIEARAAMPEMRIAMP